MSVPIRLTMTKINLLTVNSLKVYLQAIPKGLLLEIATTSLNKIPYISQDTFLLNSLGHTCTVSPKYKQRTWRMRFHHDIANINKCVTKATGIPSFLTEDCRIVKNAITPTYAIRETKTLRYRYTSVQVFW